MRFARPVLLTTTALAWLVPSLLAMWLNVERFVHPCSNAPPIGDYERDPTFQRLFFMVRYGWILVLVLAVVVAVQVRLLGRIRKGDPAVEHAGQR